MRSAVRSAEDQNRSRLVREREGRRVMGEDEVGDREEEEEGRILS